MKKLAIILLFSTLSFSQIVTEPYYGNSYEILPQLIGGLDSLQSRLIYPFSAKKMGVEGKVFILVELDSLGNITTTRVINSIGFGCDEAALRLVKTAKYTPGYIWKKLNPYKTNDSQYKLVPYRSQMAIKVIFML